MIRILLALLVLLTFPWPAAGHDSWISRQRLVDPVSKEWCCNRMDCRAERVKEVSGGYLTEAGDVIPLERVLWKSEDGSWWRCRHLDGPRKGLTRCLIGPPPGS